MTVEIRPEYLNDKTRFHYSIEHDNCDEPNESGVVEIPHKFITRLPFLPNPKSNWDFVVDDREHLKEVYLPDFLIPQIYEKVFFAVGYLERLPESRLYLLRGPYFRPKGKYIT